MGGLLAAGALGPRAGPVVAGADLRSYQREGFEWLAFLWRHRLGGVLADDMGLGKTAAGTGPDLPRPGERSGRRTVPDRRAEERRAELGAARRRASRPELSVVALTDTTRRRGQDLATAIAGADVVVTSYTLFRLDADAHERMDWGGVLFDEAQFLKNRRVEGLPVRPPGPRRVQARHHRARRWRTT